MITVPDDIYIFYFCIFCILDFCEVLTSKFITCNSTGLDYQMTFFYFAKSTI